MDQTLISTPTFVTTALPTPSAAAEISTIASASIPAASDLQTILNRRFPFIADEIQDVSRISSWMSSIQADGHWEDVDYTAGCEARRADWPAQEHWYRVLTLAAAWHGDLQDAGKWDEDPRLAYVISNGMSFWFSQDFKEPGCLHRGGTSACPCGTPGLWNRNWYSNVIGTPRLVAESCLLARDLLSDGQLASCIVMIGRSYDVFTDGRKHGFLSGANIFDIAAIGVDLALLTGNITLMSDAYERIHAEVVVRPGVTVDGIKPDGSFTQHLGLLYNGGYGKDMTNDFLQLEILAAGTSFAVEQTSAARSALESLISADLWMIYRNVETGVLHWDFSALSRFISFAVADDQATASINLNLAEIQTLGQQWNSEVLTNAHSRLVKPSQDANVGQITGNRMFWSNDYMVHRGVGYVSTVKMYSTRTLNTECTNSQNPYGFHLADGALFTYLKGTEYEDIAASWDWNMIPGITTDYNNTPLACEHAKWTGLESFVGGVTVGTVGLAAMRYTNPYTRALSWQKAIFFLDDDTQVVLISNVTSRSSAPVLTVLDQRHYASSGYVRSGSSLWHGGIGHVFVPSDSFELGVSVVNSTGDWSVLGVSGRGNQTVDLFTAWIEHKAPSAALTYFSFPATDLSTFQNRSSNRSEAIVTVQNDAHISAVYDATHHLLAAVFWDTSGGSVTFSDAVVGDVTAATDAGAALILSLERLTLTLSDPTQLLKRITVDLTMGGVIHALNFELPVDGMAGSSVTVNLK
ncbi:polysaccharide lyase family 8 protein [Vararia minispora EC-137]|uniref:Polysaccharide lyase family 8 protein n=1 Tax=Vararia minispora EC-137 TaxID=1314806 RepID=A0ACB8QVX1_9AGAM|nr:polysaccharide lyase family 8 protein [Vararia minispora EC-137]